uniref:hemicentin-1 n=1 Tax=Ciona intestinalis TaxID=7719 RepID=UPI000EF518AD|nr:hemicentin-1 [Ciona intestinalis]|eukprot:XP_018668081.2 hemicentin-1 [Ciona intestinalis]
MNVAAISLCGRKATVVIPRVSKHLVPAYDLSSVLFVALLAVACLAASCIGQSRRREPLDIRGKIRGNITGDTYTPDLTGITPGSSSLAFVFDVTGSMWDDLKQVRGGAAQILETTRNRQEKPLFNYVLIPFADPVVGPISVTTDPATFITALKGLYVEGGGDCPEMTISAIREALVISLPGSFIYVFTDARSKDYLQVPEILQIIQRKQSQVVFVLTGDCNERDHDGYRAYERIAATSSGQVFQISREQVSEVVEFIRVSVQAHKVMLLSTDHDTPSPSQHEWVLPLDPNLEELTLSISGPDPLLSIFDPDGIEITEQTGLIPQLDLEQVFIGTITEPKPGLWRIVAGSSGEHTLRVTGLSTLDFQARFSRKPTLNWTDTEYQPVANIPSYILLNATGLNQPGRFKRMKLLDIAGRPLRTLRLGTPPDPNQPYLYTVEPFMTPDVPFYIAVEGITDDGYNFIRTTKNAILNIIPTAPVVQVKANQPGYFDYPVEIPCNITSLLPYHVQWSREVNGIYVNLHSPRLYLDSATDYYVIDEVSEASEGMYRCYANNSEGNDYGLTFLDVEERPPVVTTDGNVTVTPGNSVVLTCHIQSNVQYSLRWSRVDGRNLDRRRIRKLRNGSLLIQRAMPGDEAGYQCTAVNIGGESNDVIGLIVQRPPTVIIRPSQKSTFSEGGRIRIRCKANGLPRPKLKWLKGSNYLFDIGKIRISRSGNLLEIINANQEDGGLYTCQATNRAGTDQASVEWVFTEHPVVQIPEPEMLVLEGTTATLRCVTSGVPPPVVLWSKDGNNIVAGRSFEINEEGSLVILQVARSDAGVFVCTARNPGGSDHGNITLTVGSLPLFVEPLPHDIGVDFGFDASIPCNAIGNPEPTVTWHKEDPDSDEYNVMGEADLLLSNILSISSVELDDGATYICTATNSFGRSTTTAHVTITGTAHPEVDVGDLRPHVIVGETIIIPCRIVAGNPRPIQRWKRRRVAFNPTGRVYINEASSVVITQAVTSDAGAYFCHATNVIGHEQGRVDLDVWVPPTITSTDTLFTTIEHIPVSMQCVATGNPEPVVVWRKDGDPRPLNKLSGYEVSGDGTLTILNPDHENEGSYSCQSTNAAGVDSFDVHLEIYLRPQVDSSVDDYIVTIGHSVTLQCDVSDSDPPPTFTWRKGEESITGDEDGISITADGNLTLSSATLDDAGSYTCVATNIAGSAEKNVRLTVQVPPSIRRGPTLVKVLKSETASLQCQATGLPTPTITWSRGNVLIDENFNERFTSLNGAGTSELRIRNTQLSDDDLYVCNAVNPAGRDSSSVTLDVQSRPSLDLLDICVPSVTNNNCTLTPVELGRLTLPCNASGDPRPTIRWYHDGEELNGRDPNVDIDAEGTLTLYVVTADHNGQYVCEAENERGIIRKVTDVLVLEHPDIKGGGNVERITVLEGEDVDLTCEADAVPPPTITWYGGEDQTQTVLEEREHIEFIENGQTFRITSARVSDTGLYKCTAVNKVGETHKFIRLDVYVPPTIRDNEVVSVQTVVVDESIDLHCYVDGIPFPAIRWYTGVNEVIPDDERVQFIDRDQTLRINSALVSDTGSYKCIATNVAGESSKDFDLNVHVPPFIKGNDENHVVTLDTTLVLRCLTNGIPKPAIVWTLDDDPITSRAGMRIVQDNQVIEFSNIQIDDVGDYQCTATNEAGTATKNHNVIVQVPPSISGEESNNVTVTLGGAVTITCDASGDPPPTIVWLKNGTPLFGSDESITISEDGTSLSMSEAVESDRGQYSCVASNDVGVVTHNYNLDVLVPPVISKPNERVSSVVHQTKTLHCDVYGHPFPTIRWFVYGQPVLESDRISIENRGQNLEISDVQVSDATRYTCVASNIVGRANKLVTLNVHVPATIIEPVENMVEHTVVEGQRAELTCVATGIPLPRVTWLKDGISLNKAKYLKVKDRGKVLIISKADVNHHEGRYECVANNGVGDDSRQMTLVVHVPPVIFGHSRDRTKVINIGRSEVLECRIKKGKPTPEIKWYNQDNQLINASRGIVFTNGRQRLHILSAQLSHVGNYWCEATNIAGKSRKDYTLDVIVPPSIRGSGETTKVSVVLNNDITMECQVEGIPTPTVTWRKDGQPVTSLRVGQHQISAGGTRLTVSDALESDAGRYQCLADNNAGNATKDFLLDVYLPPSIGGDSVVNITVVENTPVRMLCDVDAFPPPAITWFKNSRPFLLHPGVTLSDGDRQLDIRWAHEQDTGMFHCEAVNVAGRKKKYFRLKVLVLPTISGQQFNRQRHVVGDRIRMMCDPDGVPIPTITWTKNGEDIDTDTDVQSEGRVLVIQSAQVSHTGEFVCNATNIAGTDTKHYDITVFEPPHIVDNDVMNTILVNQGDGFRLECVVTGTPTPDIVWLKNRRRISQYFDRATIREGGRFLLIDSSEVEDAGRYTCSASNSVGVEDKHYQVNVRVPPSIRDNDIIQDLWVAEGHNISLTCDADAVPPPTIQWLVNGVLLVPNPRVREQSGGRVLLVSNAHEDDAAVYSCVATNVAGSSSRDIRLDVYATPTIPDSDVTEELHPNRGRPFRLSCPARGYPQPKIEWYKDGFRIASTATEGFVTSGYELSESGQYLTVGAAELRHTGAYMCRATNNAGEVAKKINVEVRVPPSINEDGSSPSDVTSHINTPTLLRCSAYGIPSPTIQWLKDGQAIDTNSENIVVQFGGRYLRISNTHLSDEGTYTCIASNAAGDVSRNINLHVNVPPVIEGSNELFPTAVGVPTNHTISLTCIIEEGNPFPDIVWRKGRTELQASGRVSFLSNGQLLEIEGSRTSDTGRYTCFARNSAGEDSKSFDVEVQTPPTFPGGDEVTDIDINEGSPHLIHCKITAVPLPELTWLKNGYPISESDDVFIFPGGRTLQINSAKPSDEGLYTCVATNEIGSDEKNTRVKVNVPPTIGNGIGNNIPENVVASLGEPFTLRCPVTGSPTPVITWYKNGRSIDLADDRFDVQGDGQILTILSSEVLDNGHYDCRAKNKAGDDNKVFVANVRVPPNISGPPREQRIAFENTAVVMLCDASGVPEPSLTWLRNGVSISNNPKYSVLSNGRLMIIISVQRTDDGEFTCVASNVVGQARKTYEVITYVAPVLPTTSGDITVDIGETATLSCENDAVPTPSVKWSKSGVELNDELGEDQGKVAISENGHLLIISDAQEDDVGRYLCIVSNDAGIQSKNFKVSVNVPPTISGPPLVNLTSTLGNPVTLDCDVYAVPTATITWMKDGRIVQSNNRVTILSGGTSLQISESAVHDTGSYSCHVTNVAGNAKKQQNLVVHVPPSLVTSQTNVEVVRGEDAALECLATGIPHPTVAWYRNGALVDEGASENLELTNNGLVIHNAQVSDGVEYVCEANNIAGEDTESFNVVVLVPPSLGDTNSSLDTLVVNVGEPALLECPVVGGIPPPTISWLRSGIPLQVSDRHQLLNGGRTLRLPHTQESDTARYTCVATNDAGRVTHDFDLNVQVPPMFHSDTGGEITVFVGDTITLDCTVLGTPQPEVAWSKDESALRGLSSNANNRVRSIINNQQLLIREVEIGDTGRYTCLAVSVAGEKNKNFDLNVYDLTTIDGSDETPQIIVDVGDTIDLACNAHAVPIPALSWIKNEDALIDRSRVLDNGRRMYVHSAQLSDSGTYTCIATSPAGVVEKDFDVIVHLPPTISDGNNVTAVVGENVTIECESNAVPPPTLSWLKDGIPLNFDEKYLELTNVQVFDSGIYTCVASNIAGTTYEDTKLSVYQPPSILDGPTTIIANKDDTVQLPCIGTGVPEPRISWRKDSQLLFTAPRYTFQDEGSLLVERVEVEDAGRFVCLVSNLAGSARRVITLIVQVPPVIAVGDTNVTVTVNNPVTLDCEVSGEPEPQVTWSRNGINLNVESDPSFTLLGSGSLRIASSSIGDSGYYRCSVRNPAGIAYRDISLFVQVPPSISNAPSKYTREPDTYLRIPCDVSGTPTPTVTWTMNGNSIDGLPGVEEDIAHGLVITSINLQHDGLFVCSALNPAGQARYEADVEVRVPPTVAGDTVELTVYEGDPISLPCEASGTPQPTVTWRKGPVAVQLGDRILQQSDNSLFIYTSETTDVGTYTCVAQNGAGVASHDVLLDVYTKPVFQTDFPDSRTVVVGESLLLPVVPQGHPDPSITWSKNGRLIDTEDGSLQISIVSLADEGLYSVTAQNPAGTATRYFRLIVNAPPSIDAIHGTDIVVDQGEQLALGVAVEGKPRPDVTWTKDGQVIDVNDLRIRVRNDGSLTVHDARSIDTGHYVATALNLAGRNSVEFDVLVQIPPTLTEQPSDQNIHSGDTLTLVCAATGVPVPTITWKLNNQIVPGQATTPDAPGRSRLVIENVRRQDAGMYGCEARNPAGARMAVAFVTVESPPRFIDELPPTQIDQLGSNSLLDCPVQADPDPSFRWTKDGQEIVSSNRVHQFPNGSLIIYRTIISDGGEYTCIAFNGAGSVDRKVNLVLEMAPRFVLEPENKITDAGNNVVLDCQAVGEPTPDISWTKGSRALPQDDRFSVLRNNSLRIVASRLEDTGEYECLASNFMGRNLAKALITIRVNGGFARWRAWGACSTTCGSGLQIRQRSCNNPPPANGGRECSGSEVESKNCHQGPCPIHGGWSVWAPWEECSVSCGQGTRSRSRGCNNPPAQYGGTPCSGLDNERLTCVAPPCAVNGAWSIWGPWLPCTSTCGHGSQMRHRSCNNPSPSGGGFDCFGLDSSSRLCALQPCPVDGQWSPWGSWDVCSVSCGGGSRNRIRTCSEPYPLNGGRPCSGSSSQLDHCNVDPCSVNGDWASWGTWSECSRSCGGGQMNRYRSCSNPAPRFGGRFCPGSDSDLQPCGLQSCPIDGQWGSWTRWGSCSKTCGNGERTRSRLCNEPRPQFSGRWCSGDATQSSYCRETYCHGGPREGEGIAFGTINDIPFGASGISANGTDIGGDKTRIVAELDNIPPSIGSALKSQVSILSPIAWVMAKEIKGAYNGYSLTSGVFNRVVMVEFASGDTVKMTHHVHGVNARGKLQMDVSLEGTVPQTSPNTDIQIKDYTEDYLQTGAGSLYAFSDRLMVMDGFILPYTWNHTITYNSSRGLMPFLVETLSASDILVEYDEVLEKLRFQLDVQIAPGEPSDRCPEGFLLEDTGRYCRDENECVTQRPCSHTCTNAPGSFVCGCPTGFNMGPDGRNCEDVDECSTGQYICQPTTECLNTLGSYRCVIKCGAGLKRSENGRTCEDIDECIDSAERVCSQVCLNTIGSYRCECRHGYRKRSGGRCIDINECRPNNHACRSDQRCENTDGGYRCIDDCPTGMEKNLFAVCVDIDECATGRHECGVGMQCENTEGGYTCDCRPGFKASGIEPPCVDINECLDYNESPCPHGCINTIGSFECICPLGLRYLADDKSCAGLVRIPNNNNGRHPVLENPGLLPQHGRISLVPLRNQRIFAPTFTFRDFRCPTGYRYHGGRCRDINECREVSGICQFSCNNTLGSYKCLCPIGYRVAANGRNCEDIDECAEGLMHCLPNQMCFNKRGSASCLNTPCPPSYVRVSSNG